MCVKFYGRIVVHNNKSLKKVSLLLHSNMNIVKNEKCQYCCDTRRLGSIQSAFIISNKCRLLFFKLCFFCLS